MNDELDYEKNITFNIYNYYTAMPCLLLFYHVQTTA